MNWDEEAEEAAQPFGDCRSHDMRFVHGAQWQREQLRTPEAIERGARELAGLEPGEEWPTNEQLGGGPTGDRDEEYRDGMRDQAKDFINALLGED